MKEEVTTVTYYCDVCGDEMKEQDDDITIAYGSASASGSYSQFSRSDACRRCIYRLRTGISTLIATLQKQPNIGRWDVKEDLYDVLKSFYEDDK